MFAFLKKTETLPPKELTALVSGLKLFAWMDDDELKHLVGITQVVSVKKGKYLFKEGDKSDSLYVVAKGSLRVQEQGSEAGGPDVALGVVRQGEMLGEMGLLTGEPRSASVVAAEDSLLVQIGRLDFLALKSKTEFLHFKLWCAFALHRLETHLVGTGRFAELGEEVRAAWLKQYEISELKMAEVALQPDAARYVFVAHGMALVELKEYRAPALVEIPAKAQVSGAAGHTVVLWLPKP